VKVNDFISNFVIMILGIILVAIGITSILFQSYMKVRKEFLIHQTKKEKYKAFLTELNDLLK